MNFKGFDDWIPIFRGGKQTDNKGIEHDGNALIDRAVATFDALKHEPPAVIGHPADNAPAFGWVAGLAKSNGHGREPLLLAKFKQVQPDFAGMVKQGLFKKRSAAFYPDGSLRHVGFLGAMPPAVKGLPDVAFSEAEALTFEFSDVQTVWAWQSIAQLFGKVRDYLIEKEGMDKADQVISAYQIQEIIDTAAKEKQELQQEEKGNTVQTINYKENKEENMFKEKLKNLLSFMGVDISKIPDEALPTEVPKGSAAFTEADLETAKKLASDEGAKREREKLTAEFAEKDRLARQVARKAEVASWCAAKVKEGKLTPAVVKFGLPEMLLAFAEKEDVIEFGETKEKATLYDRFKALWETEIPKIVEFKEIATRDKDTGGQGASGQKLNTLTQQKMKENKELTYSAAFAEVQRENPDLAREYAAEFKEVK